MVTLGHRGRLPVYRKNSPSRLESYFLEANLAGDKKLSMVNFLSARGKKVYADAIVKREILKHFLHTTPEELANFHKEGGLGSIQAGICGLNTQYANMLAAIFIATGQDACVHEAATASP
jgi:hydroxymethylglutaryl-CoA reductase (NADPH)